MAADQKIGDLCFLCFLCDLRVLGGENLL